MSIHRFTGRVVDKATHAGVGGLRVEAHDVCHAIDGEFAVAVTDPQGAFVIDLEEADVLEAFGAPRISFYFQILDGEDVLASTDKTLTWASQKDDSGRIEVVQSAPVGRRTKPPTQTVEGIVGVRSGNTLGVDLTIDIFERRIDRTGAVIEVARASTSSGADGSYRVTYAEPADSLARPDLLVKTTIPGGATITNTACRVPSRVRIDLVEGAEAGARHPGVPRYNAVDAAAARVLSESTPATALRDVQPAAYDYVACRAAVEEREVKALVEAGQLEFAYASVNRAVFYALIIDGLEKSTVLATRRSLLRDALLRAVDANIIAPVFRDTIEDVLDDLEAAAAVELSIPGEPVTRPFTPVGQLADLTPGVTGNAAKRAAFIGHVLRNDRDPEAFWASVEGDGVFTAADVASLKFSSEVASLVRFWPAMITKMHAERTATTVTTSRDLAKFTLAHWQGFVALTGTPDAETSALDYAKQIHRAVGTRYRTAAIAFHHSEPLVGQFFSLPTNAEFDFGTKRVGRYIVDKPTAFGSMTPTEVETTTLALKQAERLYKVTSIWDGEMQPLLNAGIGSAKDIVNLGLEGLKTLLGPNADSADAIMSAASYVSAAALALSVKYTSTYNIMAEGVFPSQQPAGQAVLAANGIPDWENLFGTLDQCACEHCHSVLSPSAYFVDLLQFLAKFGSGARDELFARRPDLKKLVLSCENGETALPYVDLVNEILEVLVSVGQQDVWPAPNPLAVVDTIGSTPELLAHPELAYRDQYIDAYLKLAQFLYPFSLPFHLWAKEARVYLEYLGVPRHTLIETFAATQGAPDPVALTVERLDIAPNLYELLSGTLVPAPQEHALWGYASAASLAQLSQVPKLLRRAGITYEELLDLLAAQYSYTVPPPPAAATPDVVFTPGANCTLADLTLEGVTGDWRHATNIIIRLRNVLGWSLSDTAKALTALSGASGATVLQSLAGIQRLVARTKLPPLEVLAWITGIDNWPNPNTATAPGGKKLEPSLFARLFLNKAVLNPDEAAFEDISKQIPAGKIEQRAVGLLPGLRLSQADFDLLTKPSVTESAAQLSPLFDGATADAELSNVSQLFTIASLARATKLQVRDLLVLRALGMETASDFAQHAAVLLDFLDLVDTIKSTGASVDEVHYVVRHVAPESSKVEPTASVKEQWLKEIDEGIAKAITDADAIEDPTGERLTALLHQIFPGDPEDPASVHARTLAFAAKDESFWKTAPATEYAEADELLDELELVVIDDRTATNAELRGAADSDPNPPLQNTLPKIGDPGARRTYLTRKLARYANIAAFVKAWASATFSMAADVTAWLLETDAIKWHEVAVPPAPPVTDPDEIAIFAFTRQRSWTDDPPSDDARLRILMRLHKASILASRFRWSSFDVRALYPDGASTTLPAIDLDTIPIERPSTTAVAPDERMRFTRWLRLGDLARLRDLWAGGAEALYAFFGGAASSTPPLIDTLERRVAAATGWKLDDIADLRERFGGTSPVPPTKYADERLLTRMVKAANVIRRLGTSAEQAIAWAEPNYALPDPVPPPLLEDLGPYLVAREIKRVAKAKNGDDAWAEIARPLRDVLRERQRATLVDYLLAQHPEWESSNDLYANLMIDVEMSPAQLTSRLVLAHSTVQTFVNRVLLNLEPSVTPNEKAARQWQWMRAYRVWEANRKVFLWPENWIEPELRDDKSRLFKQLETALLQGPLDDERAQAAFTVYLEGLSQVASLDIVAVHEELRQASSYNQSAGFAPWVAPEKILHVLGKQRHTGTHFYRRRENGEWSAWEKIDIEMGAAHLIPITIGGRLYVFWPQFGTRPRSDIAPALGEEVPTELGVKLAHSERRSSGWTAATLGPDDWLWFGSKPNERILSFTAAKSGDAIVFYVLLPGEEVAFWKKATFRFEPGTREVSANTLSDEWTYVNQPSGYGAVYQRFESAADFLGIKEYGADPGYCDILDGFPVPAKGSAVTLHRQHELAALRHQIFHRAGERTIFFERGIGRYEVTKSVLTPTLGRWAHEEVTEIHTKIVFTAELFYHPYVSSFRQALAIRGIDGLLRWADQNPKLQLQSRDLELEGYAPGSDLEALPDECVDFTYGSPYSIYNWELFFHAPLLIATRLSQLGRYADAQKWFHYIFDPTDGSTEETPKRYWKVKPFYENENLQSIQAQLSLQAANQYVQEMGSSAQWDVPTSVVESVRAQIERWRKDPFDPHAIARLRVLAYQKTVFIKYVQNLIAWGDRLFTQDTMESIAEATQLYVLAQELLGKRPVTIAEPHPAPLHTYETLQNLFDEFSNALIEIEAIAPEPSPNAGSIVLDGPTPPSLFWAKTYFCVPPNENLLGLWDVVGDRLFKIRHSMNIEGITRALPLYQPPIDPALLVQAVAVGLDIGSVLSDLNVAAPFYRYAVLYGKAMDFAGVVTSLGQSLLSALEKKDAEALGNLRAQQEVAMNDLIREVRTKQVDEARQNVATAEQSKKSAEARFAYYSAKPKVFPGERDALDLQASANTATQVAGSLNGIASILHALPTNLIGFPVAAISWGAPNLANAFQAGAGISSMVATQYTFEASNTDKLEGYARRKEDWDHQAALAKLEIEQIELNILASKIRLDLAEKELSNFDTQIEHSRAVETHLRTKFTSEDLYGWMQGQLQALYYQAYDLAYKMAKTAQRAFQYERGDDTQTFITFGSFDGSHAGLLAGEKLSHDLRRMDAAYHAQNKRELELVKTVSLAEHDPEQLVELRETGVATLTLIEDDYDRDFDTHYMRRLKSVSVTVPCTTGPYQGVHGTLSLLKGATRRTPTAPPAAYFGTIQNIATSQGQSDSGMFELNFRDDRLLPFEGVGAHADLGSPASPQWKFELSKGNRFSFDSIDDLVLDVRYTARPGRLAAAPQGGRYLRRLVRVREQHRDAWQSYLEGVTTHVEMRLPKEGWTQGRNETFDAVQRIQVFAWYSLTQTLSTAPGMALVTPALPPGTITLDASPVPADLSRAFRWNKGALPVQGSPGPLYSVGTEDPLWKIQPEPALKTSLRDLWIIFTYHVNVG